MRAKQLHHHALKYHFWQLVGKVPIRLALGSLLIHYPRVHSETCGVDKVLQVLLDLADFVDAGLTQVSDGHARRSNDMLMLMVTTTASVFIHFIIIVID